MRRLKPLDFALLAVVLPLWGAWFGLQAFAGFSDRVVWARLGLEPSRVEPGYLTVVGVAPDWPGGASLEAGDILLALGDDDLKGVGSAGFLARVAETAATDWHVPLSVRRGDRVLQIT